MLFVIQRIFDWIFLSRPIILIPVWGFSLLGYWRSQVVYNNAQFSTQKISSILPELIPLFFFSLAVASVYIINQIVDYDVDKKNGGFPLLVKSDISKIEALIAASIFFVVSMLGGYIFSGVMLVGLSLGAIFIGYIYSVKPFSFSGRPFLDFFSNGTGYGIIAFGAGWFLGVDREINLFSFIYHASPYFFCMCAGSIGSTFSDIAGDKECGKITTAVFLGNRKSAILAIVLLIASLVIGLRLDDLVAVIVSLFSIPLYVIYVFTMSRISMELTYKVGGGFMMLIVVFLYPLFIVPALFTVFTTMLYFRLRHGVQYPSLVQVEAND